MLGQLAATRIRLKDSVLARRFLGGAAWSGIGAVVSSGISLLSMMLVARLLGKETFGQFVVVQSTLGMMGVFAGLGIGATATRYVAELRLRDAARLSRILALTEYVELISGALVAVVLAALSDWIAQHLLHTAELATPMKIAALSVFFSAQDAYQKSILIGLEAMRSFAIGTIISALSSVPVMLLAAHWYGLNGAAWAMGLVSLLQAAISRVQMSRQLKQAGIARNPDQCWKEWPVLRDFALPALLGGLLTVPPNWACQAILANTPQGYAEVALLGVAMQWFNAVTFLPAIAGRVVLPILTERLAAGSKQQAAKVLKLAIACNLAVALPVTAGIILASHWILAAYGAQFAEGWKALDVAALVAILVVGVAPVGHVMAAANRMWVGMPPHLFWTLTYLCAAWYWAQYGAVGIISAMGLAHLLHSIWVVWYSIRHIGDLDAGAR